MSEPKGNALSMQLIDKYWKYVLCTYQPILANGHPKHKI